MKSIKNKFMQINCIILIILTMLSICGCTKNNMEDTMKNSYNQISMAEAKLIMENEEDIIILDVRTESEYYEGHIPQAINIPNENIKSEEIAELPDKEQKILVYCRSGNRSKQAAQKLAELGYSNIYEFGGIMDWDGEIEK